MEVMVEMRGGGRLTVHQEGPRAVLEAVRPDDRRGLYKVWLRGRGEQKLLLGTLVPQGGELKLKRTITLGEMERAGCWPEFRAESVLAFSFDKKEAGEWYCEQHPERLFTDWLLRGQIPGPMLCRREQRGFSLGAPFHTDRPLALPGLFCLAQPESHPSGVHLVWRFDEKGWPTMGRESCEVCRGHQKSVRQG